MRTIWGLLAGGLAALACAGDVRAQTCLSWTELGVSGPPARNSHAMVYDSARGVVVLFGGTTASGTLNDLWEWDGYSWTQRSFATGPSASASHGMAYDSARGVTVLFTAGKTWEWDGSSWTLASTTGPSWRMAAPLAYDPIRQVTVLFGGMVPFPGGLLAETWEWDGSSWTERQVPGPAPRMLHSMTFDYASQKVVVLCGTIGPSDYAGDLWYWDGTSWEQDVNYGAPFAGHGGAIAADPTNMRLAFRTGSTTRTSCDARTFEWDGPTIGWSQCPLEAGGSGPSGRTLAAVAYDIRHRRFVYFGGSCSTKPGETWELYLEPRCVADFNGDGWVDGIDSDQFENSFEAGDRFADLNGDGFNDGIDYDLFHNTFAAGCP